MLIFDFWMILFYFITICGSFVGTPKYGISGQNSPLNLFFRYIFFLIITIFKVSEKLFFKKILRKNVLCSQSPKKSLNFTLRPDFMGGSHTLHNFPYVSNSHLSTTHSFGQMGYTPSVSLGLLQPLQAIVHWTQHILKEPSFLSNLEWLRIALWFSSSAM